MKAVIVPTDIDFDFYMEGFLSTIVCTHRRYAPGHMNFTNKIDFENYKETNKESIDKAIKYGLYHDIYLYDHSGLDVSLDTTNDYWQYPRWDSMYLGFIYIDLDKAKKEYGKEKISPKFIKTLQTVIMDEFKFWQTCIRGDIYKVRTENEDDYDAEFIGSYDECQKFMAENNYELVETVEYLY